MLNRRLGSGTMNVVKGSLARVGALSTALLGCGSTADLGAPGPVDASSPFQATIVPADDYRLAVVDLVSGEPIPGALVELRWSSGDASLRTGSDGWVDLDGVLPTEIASLDVHVTRSDRSPRSWLGLPPSHATFGMSLLGFRAVPDDSPEPKVQMDFTLALAPSDVPTTVALDVGGQARAVVVEAGTTTLPVLRWADASGAVVTAIQLAGTPFGSLADWASVEPRFEAVRWSDVVAIHRSFETEVQPRTLELVAPDLQALRLEGLSKTTWWDDAWSVAIETSAEAWTWTSTIDRTAEATRVPALPANEDAPQRLVARADGRWSEVRVEPKDGVLDAPVFLPPRDAPTLSGNEGLRIDPRGDDIELTSVELRTPAADGRAVVLVHVLDGRTAIDLAPAFDLHGLDRPVLEPPWEVTVTDCRLTDLRAGGCEARAYRRDAFD